jgi:hypothetical protein
VPRRFFDFSLNLSDELLAAFPRSNPILPNVFLKNLLEFQGGPLHFNGERGIRRLIEVDDRG